jgi:hypothetical protein
VTADHTLLRARLTGARHVQRAARPAGLEEVLQPELHALRPLVDAGRAERDAPRRRAPALPIASRDAP